MKTVEVQVYEYDELPEEIQEKVLNKMCDINVDHDWWEFTFEDAEQVGIELSEFDLYPRKIKGIPIDGYSQIKKLILQNHGKICDTYKTVKNYDLRKNGEGEDMFKMLLEDYLSILQKEYEHLTSREIIEETLRANDYEFTEDGELF